MDAIILVGGKGTRLRSVVFDRPKPLALVNERPFLDYLLEQLEGVVSRVILAVGYRGDQVALQYGDRCLISMEEEPMGTGGAVALALQLVEGERFWVLNGDSFFAINLKEMEKLQGDLVMACRQVEDVSRYGSVEIEKGKICSFREKEELGGAGWINGGIYIMHKELFSDFLPPYPFSLEKELFPDLLLSNKELLAYCGSGDFIDIGTPKSFELAQSLMAGTR